MLQFTESDYKKAASFLQVAEPTYTPQKNILSYSYSKISTTHDKGKVGEHLLCNKLRSEYGLDAVQVGGCGRPDIEIRLSNGSVKRAECKTSMLNSNGKYKFYKVNPNNFDMLFFCYVHPTKFMIVQTIKKADFLAWTEIGGRGGKPAKRNEYGYNIEMSQDFTNDKGLDGNIWSEGGWTS